MEEKRHYKLYKCGKLWCTAVIVLTASLVGISLLKSNVHADTVIEPESQTTLFKNNDASNNEKIINTENNGNLDSYQVTTDNSNNNILTVSGWQATNESNDQPYRYAILYDNSNQSEIIRQKILSVNRNDVQRVYPNIDNSENSGFNVSFVLPTFVNGHSVSVITRYSNDPDNGEGQHTDYWFSPIIIDNQNRANLENTDLKENNTIEVSGWHASNAANGKKYHYIIAFDQTTNSEIARKKTNIINRPDVSKIYSTIGNAMNSGFDVSFSVDPRFVQDNIQFISRWTDDPAGNGVDTVDYWFSPVRIEQAKLKSINLSNGEFTVTGWHANFAPEVMPYHHLILFDNTTQQQVASDLLSNNTAEFDHQFSNVNLIGGHSYSLVSRYSNSNQGNGDSNVSNDYWYPEIKLNQRAYSIDSYQINDKNQMKLTGWFASDYSIGKDYPFIIVMMNGKEIARQSVELAVRKDVATAYPTIYQSNQSGFEAELQLPANINGDLNFVLRFSDQADGEGNHADIFTDVITDGLMKSRMIRQGNSVYYYDDQGRLAPNFVVDGILYRTNNGMIINNTNNNLGEIGQISFSGNISGISKDNRKPVQANIRLTDGTIINGWATIKWQGSSTLQWPKKGYRIKLFKDQAMTTKLKVKLPGSGFKTNSFNLKACFTDPTAGINIVNAKLFSQITRSRQNLNNSIVNDMPNYGQVTGVPLELAINGLDQGLYVLETYQEDKLYGLDDENTDNIAIADNQVDMKLSRFDEPVSVADIQDTAFVNRSPEKVDQSVVDRFNELYQLANAKNDTEYYALENMYLDVPAAIDYLVFNAAINNVDSITKNITYISKSGSKWVIMPYDLDTSWNNASWNGGIFSIDTNYEEQLKQGQQRLLLAIYTHHKNDVINRYKELRQTVLSSDNVVNEFNQWFAMVGNAAYQNNDFLWGDINLNGGSHRNSVDITSFDDMLRQRLNNVDHFWGLN